LEESVIYHPKSGGPLPCVLPTRQVHFQKKLYKARKPFRQQQPWLKHQRFNLWRISPPVLLFYSSLSRFRYSVWTCGLETTEIF